MVTRAAESSPPYRSIVSAASTGSLQSSTTVLTRQPRAETSGSIGWRWAALGSAGGGGQHGQRRAA